MHQGNLKLAPNGDIVALDFGIMGRIDEYTRRVYAEILMGFLARTTAAWPRCISRPATCPPTATSTNSPGRCGRWASRSSAMDATRISMARLLTYLFEVTERFGMETRTELILLQRTMVVVEGVSRSLYPNINIWQVASPVVEDYIRSNIGPRALLNDLVRTAQVLGRFGPKLPEIVESLLVQRNQPREQMDHRTPLGPMFWALGGSAITAAAIWIGTLI
jgi:ubiquinone biosynthesis protein